jgi:hypothetical protein
MDDLEVVRAVIDSFNRLDEKAASALFDPRSDEAIRAAGA